MPEVYFKQLLQEDCGCSAYIVGGRQTNEVAVIDPGLGLAEIKDLVALHGFRMRFVIDTHIHADHVSGARTLAATTGAALCLHESADVLFPFRSLCDGDVLALGNVSLRVLHTPGHRPESITLLVTNHARSEEPSMAITGDTLLVGDVGRPDFGGAEGAQQLWLSLGRLLALEDYVEVFPSHFDGPCGKGMCGRPSTTIGFERRFNPLLQIQQLEGFVERVTAEIPARPLNMNAIVATNRGERDAAWVMPAGRYAVTEVDSATAAEWMSAAHTAIVDVREPAEYQAGHVPGAVNIPQCELADRLDELEREREVMMVCQSGARSMRAAQFLKQVGYPRVINLRGGTAAWINAGLPVEDFVKAKSPAAR